MPRIAVFDELGSPQKILSLSGVSDNEGPWLSSGRTDYLVNPDLTGLATEDGPPGWGLTYIVPRRYWKHEAGSIVAMTAGEQTAQDAAEAAAAVASLRQGAKNALDVQSSSPLMVRNLVVAILDELNIVRAGLEEQALMWEQFRTDLAAAPNLAALKSLVAGYTPVDTTYPARTKAQVKNVIRTGIDSGSEDV